MTILYALRKWFVIIFAAIMFMLVTPNGAAPHTVTDEENCKMCITVLSDCHLETTNLPCFKAFGTILKDAGNNSFGNDVAIFLGDNTMNGQLIETPFFYGPVAKTNIADHTIIVCGNHDVGNGEGDYDKLYKRFKANSECVTGIYNDKPYYSVEIKGITFVVLCPEDLCVNEFPISDAQYEFLDETLKACTAAGKPTFVLAHHPVYDVEEDDGERLEEILSRYPNVFYVSGHTHWPACDNWTFWKNYGYSEINLPRTTDLWETEDGGIDCDGDGVQLEIYDNEVIARVRDFYHGEWKDDLTYHFTIE